MNGKLIGIMLESGIGLIAGLFVSYLGYVSPVFHRSSERLAPDRWVGTFRLFARIAGPALCVVVGLRAGLDVREQVAGHVLNWRETTSTEGRFQVSAPGEFTKKVQEKPYGRQRVSESCLQVQLPKLGFLVSYFDLPGDVRDLDAKKLLDDELDANLHTGGIELLSRDATVFAGYPAVRFRIRNSSGGYFVKGVLLLAKGRRYQLAFQYISQSLAPSGDPFFDSFRVLDRP